MFKTGEKAYFVPSLWENGIQGKITIIETFRDKPFYITITTDDGNTISGYVNQFSETRPRRYNAERAQEKKNNPSVYFDKSSGKPVTIEQLKESYNHFSYNEAMSFREYLETLTVSGCFIPYKEYLESLDN